MCRWSSERERARDVVDDDRSTEDSGPPRAGVDDDDDDDGDDDGDDGDDDDARCVYRCVLLHSSPSSFSSSPSRGRADRSIVITHHHREGVLSKDGEGGAPRGGREGEREGRAREGRDGWDS